MAPPIPPHPTSTREGRLLTVASAAAALSISPKTVRDWLLRRRCPVVHVGRCVRIPAAWVEDYIERHTTPALPERGR